MVGAFLALFFQKVVPVLVGAARALSLFWLVCPSHPGLLSLSFDLILCELLCPLHSALGHIPFIHSFDNAYIRLFTHSCASDFCETKPPPKAPNLDIMKFEITPARAAALVALISSVEAAHHGHSHHHEHANEARTLPENHTLEKKSGQCQFPSDAGLVAITPSEQNAGWAMSPNQPCKPGNYCPYACPPGQVSMQWDPEATSYSYPMSMVSLVPLDPPVICKGGNEGDID